MELVCLGSESLIMASWHQHRTGYKLLILLLPPPPQGSIHCPSVYCLFVSKSSERISSKHTERQWTNESFVRIGSTKSINYMKLKSPNVEAKWCVLLLCIREVPGSNLGPKSGCPEVFRPSRPVVPKRCVARDHKVCREIKKIYI
jgi:hypothetical protein